MVLGMEIGLSSDDIVLDGDPARPLNFRPMFVIVIVISLEHCTFLLKRDVKLQLTEHCTGVRRYWFAEVQVKF